MSRANGVTSLLAMRALNRDGMTPELAERVLNRQVRGRPYQKLLTDAQEMAVLMDWIEGMPYREIVAKHKVSKAIACRVIKEAKKEARQVLSSQ